MSGRRLFLFGALLLLLGALLATLSFGPGGNGVGVALDALLRFDAENYDHYVVLYQRLPRALIAIYVGAVTASAGAVLQGLTRNPLASPTTLGVSAGAALFVVAGVSFWEIGVAAQGLAALIGGMVGFLGCLAVASMAGLSRDPRGLSLILSGTLTGMLFFGFANMLLLSDPARRNDFLGWLAGDINHVYADRLSAFWWIGALCVAVLMLIARPLTLLALGAEKAASAGVNVARIERIALFAVAIGAASATAICGPVAFVGLITPHIVRPFAGGGFAMIIPACAAIGAAICLFADLIARNAFAPYTLHTGVIMDLMGGFAFALIVKRFYLTSGARRLG